MNWPFVQITFLSNFEIAPLFLFSNKNKNILHVLSTDVRSKMGWGWPRNVRRWKNGLRGDFDVRLSLSTEHYSKEKKYFRRNTIRPIDNIPIFVCEIIRRMLYLQKQSVYLWYNCCLLRKDISNQESFSFVFRNRICWISIIAVHCLAFNNGHLVRFGKVIGKQIVSFSISICFSFFFLPFFLSSSLSF